MKADWPTLPLFSLLFLFIFPQGLGARGADFKSGEKWVVAGGWRIPEAGQMKLEKSEPPVNISGLDICAETFSVEQTYTVREKEKNPEFRVGKKEVENDIEKMRIYSVCGSPTVLCYWVQAIEVKQRDSELGVMGNGVSLLFADLNRDGIFEACYVQAYDDFDDPGPYISQAIAYFCGKQKK